MRLHAATLLVRDYDEAIEFFTTKLGFHIAEDSDLGGGKRWVRVTPTPDTAGLLLARAVGAEQVAAIGKAAGGRVAFFLHTDDFATRHAELCSRGVYFREQPRREAYGMVAVFEDLYGNPWDLVGPGQS
ncbi:MAG: extradiol dioxygenase [Alphaproteobacteria bacterium PA4]|nr:MAG: extradiol dioxygenase [Alphaproteobacteria bacterium PA4]